MGSSRVFLFIYSVFSILTTSIVSSFQISVVENSLTESFSLDNGVSNSVSFSFDFMGQDSNLFTSQVTNCGDSSSYDVGSVSTGDSSIEVSLSNIVDVGALGGLTYCVDIALQLVGGSPAINVATLKYQVAATVEAGGNVITSTASVESNQIGFQVNDQGTKTDSVSVAPGAPTLAFQVENSGTILFGSDVTISVSTQDQAFLSLASATCQGANNGPSYDLNVVEGTSESFQNLVIVVNGFLLQNWIAGDVKIDLGIAWRVAGSSGRRLRGSNKFLGIISFDTPIEQEDESGTVSYLLELEVAPFGPVSTNTDTISNEKKVEEDELYYMIAGAGAAVCLIAAVGFLVWRCRSRRDGEDVEAPKEGVKKETNKRSPTTPTEENSS